MRLPIGTIIQNKISGILYMITKYDSILHPFGGNTCSRISCVPKYGDGTKQNIVILHIDLEFLFIDNMVPQHGKDELLYVFQKTPTTLKFPVTFDYSEWLFGNYYIGKYIPDDFDRPLKLQLDKGFNK